MSGLEVVIVVTIVVLLALAILTMGIKAIKSAIKRRFAASAWTVPPPAALTTTTAISYTVKDGIVGAVGQPVTFTLIGGTGTNGAQFSNGARSITVNTVAGGLATASLVNVADGDDKVVVSFKVTQFRITALLKDTSKPIFEVSVPPP